MSSTTVIKAEHIAKLYRLGQVGTGTLSHDLKRWWAMARGKEDPYLKVGVQNDRTRKAESEYAWALRDVSFDIQQGDTLGIIGRNGAGKSTLLKILSRVTGPTHGQISIKGRIASLLEVGTGFHPELTGRENIYMNGAILGMTRREISARFDEIVDFAGVQMYIDTPVKRYSSGMYVRLAFAVAAHLEPEILVVDEVLAVGDADFQKKCLGKMGDVASHGRTVIFVSHNMTAVQTLCKKALYLREGHLANMGSTDKVIADYLGHEVNNCIYREWTLEEAFGSDSVIMLKAAVANSNEPGAAISVSDPVDVSFEFRLAIPADLRVSLLVYAAGGACVFNAMTGSVAMQPGRHQSALRIPANFFNDGQYTMRLIFVKDTTTHLLNIADILSFEVVDNDRQGSWFGKWEGAVRPSFDFSLT
jgi:lipopolysaccharide transport system ATP-binding protein